MDLITLGIAIALSIWSRRLAARPGAPRFLRYFPYPLFLGWAVGTFGTIYWLVHSFNTVAAFDPAEKATYLAQGISKAMNWVAFESLVVLIAFIALIIFAIRLRTPRGAQ